MMLCVNCRFYAYIMWYMQDTCIRKMSNDMEFILSSWCTPQGYWP